MEQRRNIRKWIVVMGLVCWTFISSASDLFAYRMELLNLQEMTTKADRIFAGIPTNRKEGALQISEGGPSIPYIEYTFKVNHLIKGHIGGHGGHGETLVIRQVDLKQKMQISSFDLVPMPDYTLNQEVIVFLGKDSEFGFTSPVAMSHAVFNVQTIHDQKFVKNHMGKKLLASINKGAKEPKGLAPNIEQETKGAETKIGDIIPYESFLSLVQKVNDH